jgi:hypothetical protein
MLDKALTEAIAAVVTEEDQPKTVAMRLTAWLTRMSEVELGRDENTQFLQNVRDALLLPGTGDAH